MKINNFSNLYKIQNPKQQKKTNYLAFSSESLDGFEKFGSVSSLRRSSCSKARQNTSKRMAADSLYMA
jgi:hypothetical protein